jgi:hypothetical protein
MMHSQKNIKLKWWVHVYRMEQYRMVRGIFGCSPMGKRSRGHPRDRWWDEVLKDVRVLDAKNWTTVVMDKWA